MHYTTRLRIKQILYFFTFPLCFFLFYFSNVKNILVDDLKRYKSDLILNKGIVFSLWENLLMNKCFRNVFYLRVGIFKYFLCWILKPIHNIELCNNIGGGFLLLHGFNVVINPRVKIGKNCTILHNVTIGDVKGGVPLIGDNVSIGTGAVIIGNIHIGNNVKIGAGAIVVDNVPDGVTIVGPKAKVIMQN